MSGTNSLFLRALAAFLVLPGTVAILIPGLLMRPAGAQYHPAGIVPLALGATLLLWCVRDFYIAGKGTLAPWSPPRKLVTTGLYKYTRNPMYIAVISMVCGWALGYRSLSIWIYAIAVTVAFHLRVVLSEEPWLARAFGEEWSRYRDRVPRWLAKGG